MALHNTLRRQKIAGPSAPFTVDLRKAVAVDISRVLWAEETRSILNLRDLLYETQMDIVQHVLDGIEPTGPFVQEARVNAPSVSVEVGHWAFIRAYILDIQDDLGSLDAIAVILRHLSVAARGADPFSDTVAIADDIEQARPEIRFIIKVLKMIAIVNQRLRESEIGFQFVKMEFVSAPEPEFHSEVLAPCLLALRGRDDLHDVDVEFTRALQAWRKQDFKHAVHASGEALEGMLRILAKSIPGSNHKSSDQIAASVDKLASQKLWLPPYNIIMKQVQAIRGELGAHSEGTKPMERRASPRDARSMIFIAATMILHIADILEDREDKESAPPTTDEVVSQRSPEGRAETTSSEAPDGAAGSDPGREIDEPLGQKSPGVAAPGSER